MPVPEDIKRAFASGATILTANVRAARWLRREYGLEQRGAGRRAWAAPAIWDWDTWVRDQWHAQALADPTAPLLLTSLQERSVWARMQREDASLLVSPASVAALAEGAYAGLSDYEAHSERKYAWGKADAERFRQWASNFDRECARWNWMPRAGLEARVSASLNEKTLPRDILLAGFDRTTPAQDSLLRALIACGVAVKFADAAVAEGRTEFVRAPGLREEIEACGWWARSEVEKNPEARIGVLVPDLASTRSDIERIFRRVLMPQADDIFSNDAMPFEFSLGQPLAHVPPVRAALMLLRWLNGPLREEEVSWLLLSGFLASSDGEYLAFARNDARRRNLESLSLEIALGVFLKQSRRVEAPSLKRFENALRAAVANEIAEKERLPGRWVDVVQLLLREAGWPGEAERGALHFQVLRRWERALDEIALLDFDGRSMQYQGFLQALEGHALETIFSPESVGAPVQIMGTLEASGQQFDALWFLCADDASWPHRGQPNPLLPNDVQRRSLMPYSDAESDLELAKAVTERIAASAAVVVFSHAERNKDGELRPSPVLPKDAEWERAQAPLQMLDNQTHALREIEDASGSIAWPLDRSPGGADVLKKQAACAFQAFVAKRLRAEPLNRNDWGLSAAERGSVLHRALEKIWSPVGGALHSLDDLRAAIEEGRLTEIVRSAIAEVFARFDVAGDTWIEAYLMSEQRRLQLRIEEWMRIEAARAPFKVIACEEKLEDVNVGGLPMRLRADRIDEVANSDRLLIDYKSGIVSPGDWQPPRLNEPQLPLYAVFGKVEDVRGVLFGRIRAGETGFEGCVEDVGLQLFGAQNSKVKESYTDAMRDEWHDALLTVADGFLRGEAMVNPKDGKKTCKNCAFPGLCRVAEVRDPLEETGDAEGNDNGE